MNNKKIHQKLLETLAKRGIVGTIKRCGLFTRDFLRWYLDASFDRRHSVDSSKKMSLSELKIDSTHLSEATWYEPVPTLCFRQIMQELLIDFEKYFFIDFGSGKGRALFLAADYPFARVIGIEFSPELHAVALQNITIYRNPRQKCHNIESICTDAVDYQLPPVKSVLFFYSPFKAPVFVKVVDNIIRSLKEYPRSIYIVFIGLIPESIQVLKNFNLSYREIKLGPDYVRLEKKVGLILHSGITED